MQLSKCLDIQGRSNDSETLISISFFTSIVKFVPSNCHLINNLVNPVNMSLKVSRLKFSLFVEFIAFSF